MLSDFVVRLILIPLSAEMLSSATSRLSANALMRNWRG